MKLSTRARYGARAMVELAKTPGASRSVRDVARNQRVSAKYLEHIMASLKSAGLVEAVRGLNGGYTLARGPGEIRLSDVILALEGPLAPVDCVSGVRDCPMAADCPTREVWAELKRSIMLTLDRVTLKDLVDRRHGREPADDVPMYHI